MRFRLLGPLEVHAAGRGHVSLSAAKQRTALVVLLLHANRPVSVDRLTAALWPGRPPRSAAGNVRTYMAALRQALGLDDSAGLPRLTGQAGAYRLDLDPADLDVLVFESLVTRGCRALDRGDVAGAAGLLRDGLALWRGRPAEDVAVDGEADAVVAALDERRLMALEAWGDARLALGHDGDLVAGLRGLVADHPFRERLWCQLMTALYRTGRQAEALAVFAQLRRQVVTELGIEPGAQVQELHRQLLAGDVPGRGRPARPAGVLRAAATRPAQLPPGATHFTGRAAELDELDALLAPAAPPASGDGGRAAPLIVTISGTPGVGKTALALRWAHELADRFADGQLYANLRGYAPGRPADPLEVLGAFLRALGIPPGQVPGDLDEAAALYRSLLAGQRMLILLDNAATTAQVRPLLAGSAHCVTIVTSRSRLAGLAARDGARRVTLGPLAASEALLLLGKILGQRRVQAEPQAAAEIARRCAFLPLALRIAAERVADRPRLALAELAGQLAAERGPLDLLVAGTDDETTARSVFSWSYLALPAAAARMFRLLSLHPGPDASVAAAAALAGSSDEEARRRLDGLAGAHLLEEAEPGRYQYHDLLRAYAAERLNDEDDARTRMLALQRLLTWYLHATGAAGRLLAPAGAPIPLGDPPPGGSPAFGDYEDALAWYDHEYPGLVAAVELAAQAGLDEVAWKIAAILHDYYVLRRHAADWISTSRTGLACARRAGDRLGEAWLLNVLGGAYFDARRLADALDCIQKALGLRRQIGDRTGESTCLTNLGIIHLELRQADQATGCVRQALDLCRETGDRRNEAAALHGLGEITRQLGRPEESLPYFGQALDAFRDLSEPRGECYALQSLGETCLDLRRTGEALGYVDQALAIRRRTSDRQGEAETLRARGDILTGAGQPAAARQSWRQALVILEELDDPQAARLRDRLTRGGAPADTPGVP